MYYEKTIEAIRMAIADAEPSAIATFSELEKGKQVPLSYLLWMCGEVEKMYTVSIDDAIKAGRWMGWIFAHLEMQGLWDNQQTRNLVRLDRALGNDKPHQKR